MNFHHQSSETRIRVDRNTILMTLYNIIITLYIAYYTSLITLVYGIVLPTLIFFFNNNDVTGQ